MLKLAIVVLQHDRKLSSKGKSSLLCKLAYSQSSGKMCQVFQHNSHQNRELIMLKIMLA